MMTVTLPGGCPHVNGIVTFSLERTWGLKLGDSRPNSVTLKKNHWRSELEVIIVIMLSTPRFDEKGNGGPERSGHWPESRLLRVEAGAGLWGGEL